jgi:hypothetical protein
MINVAASIFNRFSFAGAAVEFFAASGPLVGTAAVTTLAN